MKRLISIILILTYTAMADDSCTQPVQYLTKGTPAQCSGYLFSPATEQSARLAKEQLDNLQQEFSIQTDKINLLTQDLSFYKDQQAASQQQVQLWQDSEKKCSAQIAADNSDRWLRDAVAFGAGVITILLAGIALRQVK
jgi:hypothetical protein